MENILNTIGNPTLARIVPELTDAHANAIRNAVAADQGRLDRELLRERVGKGRTIKSKNDGEPDMFKARMASQHELTGEMNAPRAFYAIVSQYLVACAALEKTGQKFTITVTLTGEVAEWVENLRPPMPPPVNSIAQAPAVK